MAFTTSSPPCQSDNEGNEKILGYSYENTLRPGDPHGAAVEFNIYVAPSASGKGYGSKLLTALVEALKAIPVSEKRSHGVKVFVCATVSEKRNAANFYLRVDFERRGTLKKVGWKMGRWIDNEMFPLSLGQNDGESQESRGSRYWWVSGLFAWKV
ncbi:hypothetical protein N7G274_004144 [Stereocaulon virgatum]|uniref:N-acetyltransferase domain-containing protein n=1 Tax=Stereocaulon virgatum TaxID=373712 RepID=A0ABR4AED3_9LECA